MANLDNDGEIVHVPGSGAKPYECKNVGGVLSCSCPAWRNFGGPIDKRTCKHLKKVRGEASELARIGVKTHDFGSRGPVSRAPGVIGGGTPGSSGPTGAGEIAVRAINTQAAQNLSEGKKLRQDEKAKLYGPPILLAHSFEDYEDDIDVRDWWMSEKLDGVRAYWNGKDFVSRQGNVYPAPDWFKAGLPQFPLDGELWMGRKMFQKTISVVKSAGSGDRWKDVTFMVFDAPEHTGKFEDRMVFLLELEANAAPKHMRVLRQERVHHLNHLLKTLEEECGKGAEGLMIRKPGSAYEVGRSSTILKVKPFKDAEAVVVAHVPGKGKHKGRLGGLEVRMPDGKTFNVGTGLTDEERRSPPRIGATITYRYTETTDGGIPKCASFVSVRDYE